MDFLSGLAKSAQSKPEAEQPTNADNPEKRHSNSELMANAKVVAEAVQAQLGKEPEKCDKSKAAHAAADLLDAAEQYAKLDDSQGVGKYMEQAEGYLRKYDGAPPAAGHKPDAAAPPAGKEEAAAPAPEPEKKSEGGSADLLKAAGSFFK